MKFIIFGSAAFMAGMAVLARWLPVRDGLVFVIDLIALYLLIMTIQTFDSIALRLRLISLCRQLLQPAKEEESTDNE